MRIYLIFVLYYIILTVRNVLHPRIKKNVMQTNYILFYSTQLTEHHARLCMNTKPYAILS
jgi:hypothetical protein